MKGKTSSKWAFARDPGPGKWAEKAGVVILTRLSVHWADKMNGYQELIGIVENKFCISLRGMLTEPCYNEIESLFPGHLLERTEIKLKWDEHELSPWKSLRWRYYVHIEVHVLQLPCGEQRSVFLYLID